MQSFFKIALIEEWKTQLGAYMIDYNTLIIEETIAKGTVFINNTASNSS